MKKKRMQILYSCFDMRYSCRDDQSELDQEVRRI